MFTFTVSIAGTRRSSGNRARAVDEASRAKSTRPSSIARLHTRPCLSLPLIHHAFSCRRGPPASEIESRRTDADRCL
jgi:hypothetical protein